MFVNSRRIVINANRLAQRKLSYPSGSAKSNIECQTVAVRKIHTSPERANYAAAAILPIPNNIDAAETTRFSPQRSRDISANVIDITTDNTFVAPYTGHDPHIQSYDCFGAVSLNSVMQSNVPTPFSPRGFSHLNMPGGQWSQENKFTSQNLHSSHYTALRDSARSDWVSYDQDATINKKAHTTNWNVQGKRSYCTAASPEQQQQQTQGSPKALSKKEQLKIAFKEYGATLVVFHVSISLISLGGFYLLVSSGIDMMPVLERLGFESTTLTNKIASGASTFVVAYAVHKVFAPVRISITLGSTPFIVRFMRSKGFLKHKQKQID